MMLTADASGTHYRHTSLTGPSRWNLSRKHVRAVLPNGCYMKLNHRRPRLNRRALQSLCARYAPKHVYMSVLNWLFPDRVGKKYKGKYVLPISGEFVVDVDSAVNWIFHNHDTRHPICLACLEISRRLTLHVCEVIEENYRNVQIVFSGRRGFHIHVLDFHLRDWTYYNPRNPIKSHAVARFKYTQLLAARCLGFDRSHFIVSVDPMRVITVPNSLNGHTGLVCIPLGNRQRLEQLTVEQICDRAFTYAHPELVESLLTPTLAHGRGVQ
jgi:DNA primase catalytic subunit